MPTFRVISGLLAAGLVGWGLMGCGAPERYGSPREPDAAPEAAVDRFGDYGTLFNRDSPRFNPAVTAGVLPGPNEPFDMDALFLGHALGPDGGSVRYYALDIAPPLPNKAYLVVAEDGEPVAGQLPVVATLPGDEGYNDFVQIYRVWVGDDYPANSLTSVAAIEQANEQGVAVVQATRLVQNWPLVPAGTTAAGSYQDAPVAGGRAWHDDEVVHFLKFEALELTEGDAVPQSTVIVIFADGESPAEGFVTEPDGVQTHNVFETVPGDDGYSSLWVHRSGDPAGFDGVVDWPTAVDNTIMLLSNVLVNCPIVDD